MADTFPPPDTIRSCNSCGEIVPISQPCLACALLQLFPAPSEPTAAVKPVALRFDPSALPCLFGSYVIRREIAVGGMGAVYEAYDPRLGRSVALKMMRSLLLATSEEKARFKSEAGAAAQLDHPNIVPVYEVGEQDGQPYFTMKLIDGDSLAGRLKDGPIAPREAGLLVANIARGVAHAHERGVLHRDLKPGNIVIDASGTPWLTDFGLAKVASVDSNLTLTESFLGTPAYMSPEQAAGRTREIGPASDVWALGVILFQLVTGRLPFSGHGHAEIMQHIIHDEPASFILPASGSRSVVDPDLETIILRCLAKDSNRRINAASFLADELERWLAGEPIHSRGITPAERALRWLRRHPWPVATTVLAASVVVLAVTNTRQPVPNKPLPPPRPIVAFQNGSFEIHGGDQSGAATPGWIFGGRANGVKLVMQEGTTDGRNAAVFNGAIHDVGGMLSQSFTTEAGRTYTVQFDFGNYGHYSTPLQKLRVEVSNGDSPSSGASLINPGSGQIDATSDGYFETNTNILVVVDDSAAHVPSKEFSQVTFTFTARSAVSTLSYTDVSTGYVTDSDGVLDNVQVR